MTTRECAYCGATNDAGEAFCGSCGIPQVSADNEKPELSKPAGSTNKAANLGDKFADPAMRWTAVALGALALFVLGFFVGRVTSGDSEAEAIAAPAVETTVASAPSGTDTTAATTTAAPATTTTTTEVTTTTTEPPFAYADVPADHEHAVAVQALLDAGVVAPCDPPAGTSFCPDDALTRAGMASLLTEAMGYTDSGSEDLFDDDNGSPFEDSIQAIAVAGITKGCNPPDNTRYCPDDLVTRGQIAAFLNRAFEFPAAGATDYFSDDDGTLFEPSIQKLAAAGVMTGCDAQDETLVCPGDPVTRGEMASFLVRALG